MAPRSSSARAFDSVLPALAAAGLAAASVAALQALRRGTVVAKWTLTGILLVGNHARFVGKVEPLAPQLDAVVVTSKTRARWDDACLQWFECGALPASLTAHDLWRAAVRGGEAPARPPRVRYLLGRRAKE